jgi:acyl-CoA synthetase (AMP-forming)/AMP-acid ligase II
VGERLRPTWWHDDHPTAAGCISDLAPPDPRVARLAGALAARGVGRGDAVAWQLPNGEHVVLALWACWRLGAVAVPVHHRATAVEAERLLDALPVRLVLEAGRIEGLIDGGEPFPESLAAPDDVALVLHTSGSSGAPKAVLHTQATLAHKARTMVGVHGLGPDDVVLMPAPLGHISGILNGVTVPAAARMGSVLMSRWDPDEALALIERHRVSFMVGPPTFFLGLQDAGGFDPARVSSLRLVSAGGAGVTEAFCAATADAFGAVVKRSYGSTEAPTVATSRVGDDPARGWTTDGRAVPGARLRVDDGGELQVRGPELFVGYADPARNTTAVTDDGWFRTGDTAALDDGWLVVTGRLSDVIIRGGENISPGEVEAVLEAHPAVRSAVVVGRPDGRLGERACAVLMLWPGSFLELAEVQQWCDGQGLARFKWPERVEVVEAIPVLGSGKPDRAALRARSAN